MATGEKGCYRLNLPPEGLGQRFASTGPFFSGRSSPSTPATIIFMLQTAIRLLHDSRFRSRSGLLVLTLISLGQFACSRSVGARSQPAIDHSLVSEPPVRPSLTEDAPVAQRLDADPEGVVSLPGGVQCDRTRMQVLVPGEVAIDVGFLEQVACIRGTREHESLVVVECRPSEVHAALLLLGIESGAPGRWTYSETGVSRVAPRGDRLRVEVRFVDPTGAVQQHPIGAWIVGEPGDQPFPTLPWIFGGSRVDPTTGFYAADASGSLVGLVTFGDEVLGLESVVADSIEVDVAVWQARTPVIPAPGTPVLLILSPWVGESALTPEEGV